MKTQIKVLLCTLLTSTTLSGTALAQSGAFSSTSNYRPSASTESGNFGLGAMLGEPTGVTGKYWLSNTQAFDAGVAFSFSNYTAFLGDFLWHAPRAFENPAFVPYFGVGAIAFINNDSSNSRSFFLRENENHNFAFGIRAPLGMEYLPKKVPLGLFVELVPGLGIIPGTFGFIEGETGARFYF